MFPSPHKLLVVMDKGPTVLYRTIERLATNWKFFRDSVYGSKIVVIYGSFCLSGQHNNEFPLATVHDKLQFLKFSAALQLDHITFTPQAAIRAFRPLHQNSTLVQNNLNLMWTQREWSGKTDDIPKEVVCTQEAKEC